MFMNYFSVDVWTFSQSNVVDFRVKLSWMILETICNGTSKLLNLHIPEGGFDINITSKDLERYEQHLQPTLAHVYNETKSCLYPSSKKPRIMKTSFSTNDSLIDLIDRDNIVSPNRFLCRSDTYNNNGIITIQDESNDYSLIRDTYNSNGIITIHDESDQVETADE